MSTEDLDEMLKKMELLPRWQLLILWFFMEVHTAARRLAKWIKKEIRSKHEQQ